MQQVLKIAGMHCGACVNRVERALKAVTPNVTVSLDPPQAVIDSAEPVPRDKLEAAVTRAGYAVERAT